MNIPFRLNGNVFYTIVSSFSLNENTIDISKTSFSLNETIHRLSEF